RNRPAVGCDRSAKAFHGILLLPTAAHHSQGKVESGNRAKLGSGQFCYTLVLGECVGSAFLGRLRRLFARVMAILPPRLAGSTLASGLLLSLGSRSRETSEI